MATKKKEIIRKNKKLIIVGDGMCGKTCLLLAYKNDEFVTNHEATVFDTYVTDIQVDGETIDIALFDTAGQEDYRALRALVYSDTDVILVCFSVDNPVSAAHVSALWMAEFRHFCDPCPVILVACKKDLRTDPTIINELKRTNQKPVTREMGKEIAAQMKVDAYIECSAKTREGIQDLFIQAARLSLRKKSHRSSFNRCVLF